MEKLENIINVDYAGEELAILKEQTEYILLNCDSLQAKKFEELEELFEELDNEKLENIYLNGYDETQFKAELDIVEPTEEDNFKFLYVRELI